MGFNIGQTYYDKNGNSYTLLSVNNGYGTFKFNKIEKRFKIINFGGVESVVQYGEILIKSEKIKPIFDPDLDIKNKTKSTTIINTNIKGYIDVFKSHIK